MTKRRKDFSLTTGRIFVCKRYLFEITSIDNKNTYLNLRQYLFIKSLPRTSHKASFKNPVKINN